MTETQTSFFKYMPECRVLATLSTGEVLFVDEKDRYKTPRILTTDGRVVSDVYEYFTLCGENK